MFTGTLINIYIFFGSAPKKNELFFQLRHDTDKQATLDCEKCGTSVVGCLSCVASSHACKLCSAATNIVENEEPFNSFSSEIYREVKSLPLWS